MERTLQPEDRIAHYRVVGPLAAGGMGEVYIAQDQTLDRSVALKVLPARLVRNEERVRRFVTEAKSASSLSHPHIVTIYEIGQDRVRSGEEGEADPASDPVHYISMELITGETLKDKIHHEKTDLKTLLGYLVQAAEGLAKAHASGIVHRDLKPGNIMISRDGYAKVLDFGLAKLVEQDAAGAEATLAGATRAATEADATGEGVVLGTVGYMSPEQVRGKAVDHRSDIFSFGCLLYEAATRRRPFAADSDVETMHQILNQQPDRVEAIAPETPNALRRLIGRCLAKSPDQRLQSMKDLAIELREIVDEFDRLSPSGSASSITPPPAPAPPVPHRRLSPAAIGAGVVGAAGIALAVWALSRGPHTAEVPPPPASGPAGTMTMTSLVSAENLSDPVLSPDGRYLAYVSGHSQEWSLWVFQVATGSKVRVAGPERTLSRVSFSPDGNYVFFAMRDPDTPNYSAIFSVPSLGGTPRKRLFDVDTPVSFSPDGTQACFLRGVPQQSVVQLVVAQLASGEERILDSTKLETSNLVPSVWSPDGGTIAWTAGRFTGGLHFDLLLYDAATGKAKSTALPKGFYVNGLQWLPDGSALVSCATDARNPGSPQIWLIPLPQGAPRRVTNDLNSYGSVSIGEGGKAIAASRSMVHADIWTVGADGSGGAARQITFGGGGAEAISNLCPLPDGTLVFVSQNGAEINLWRMNSDGSSRRAVSTGSTIYFSPFVAGNTLIAGHVMADFIPHVLKIDVDGGGEHQITRGNGEIPVALSPDGRSVLYTPTDRPSEIWLLPAEGEEPRVLVKQSSGSTTLYSPDGRWIAYRELREHDGRWTPTTLIIPAEGGDPVLQFRNPPSAGDFHWTPDSHDLTFLSGDGEQRNVYRLTMGGSPEPVAITHFTDGTAVSHQWSPDGKRILLARRVGSSVSLWIVPLDGDPFPVATFPTGFVYETCWLPDGKTVAFRYGTESLDVVLIRGFR